MAFGPETIGFGFPVHGVEVTLCTEMLGAFRRPQDFEQCFFANVGIGIVDEHARVGVAVGVDIQVYAELFALRDGRNYRENKSAGLS